MKIAAMTFRLHAPWAHSLKEKRMIVKSLIAKLQNKYHVSAAEIDEQDTHHTEGVPCGDHRNRSGGNSPAHRIGGQPDGGNLPVRGSIRGTRAFLAHEMEAEILDEEREIR